MFQNLFRELKRVRVPVSLPEYLDLMAAMDKGLADFSVDEFYYLSRALLVKDERHLDRFDQVFGHVFKGLERVAAEYGEVDIPEEWLKRLAELNLSEEEMAKIEALGGWEKLMETLRERLAEQEGRHQGGSKWIGTAGTSPFGAYGYNPEGVRIGQREGRQGRAVKVWDKREFRDLDGEVELGTRGMKIALRRLRRFAREGALSELDIDDTIHSTAKNGGWLDLRMVAERHNAAKVLLLLDVGGSMNAHVRGCERLFSAARGEFKHLEYFYFHNCPYEGLWRDNRRRRSEQFATWELINSYNSEYKMVFVGDAFMSPYEIVYPGASVEHFNQEPGELWLKRLLRAFPKAVWLNPLRQRGWHSSESIKMIQELMEMRMYPLTLDGLDAAMRELSK
ncbi:MAG: VWA domain-containing protein [Alphaproteobacteria bacterium]|nr:VWA domain-containing protein [Alphaproteobacteria bacterium]